MKGITGLLVFVLGTFAAQAVAARGVSFKMDPTPLKAMAGEPYRVDLKTLVNQTGNAKLTWSSFSDKPAWLTLNSAESTLSGTPSLSDIGVKRFRLSVQDGETGQVGRIDMTVSALPVWNESPLNLGIQKEDVPFQLDLNTKVTNTVGGALVFSSPSGLPSWLSLKSTGILSGTPRRADVGDYTGLTFVTQNTLGETAAVSAFGKVEKVVKPPRWKFNPIALASAQEDFAYVVDLSTTQYVSQFEPEPVRFRLVTGTSSGWLSLSSDGKLTGVPGAKDVGTVSVQVELASTIDGKDYKDVTTVEFDVLHTNHAPKWDLASFQLPDAFTRKAYFEDLMPRVSDVDGDALKIKIISGPTWALVSAAGVLAGTPANSDFGLNTFVLEVSDGDLTSRATAQVQVVNRLPKWLVKPLVLVNAAEDVPYSKNLATNASDADNDPLTFSKLSGPNWVSISATGTLSGTPGAGDLGATTVRARVSDGVSGFDEVDITFSVDHTNHAPVWAKNPILLPGIPERVAFSASIAAEASDVDKGDILVFKKVSGPVWLQVADDGSISGTPLRPDVGVGAFQVRVSDQVGASAVVTLQIPVLKVNQSPVWTQNPLPLVSGLEDAAYTFDLKPFATDEDADTLIFTLVSGPAWMKVATNGKITGTPSKPDVGPFSAVFEVSDGKLSAQDGGTAAIVMKNYPPVLVAESLIFQVKERSTLAVDLTDPKYVFDPNNDKLTFALVAPSDFATLSATGQLKLAPLFKHIGKRTLAITVTDGKLTTAGTIQVDVLRDPRPPVWSQNPISFQTKARVAFNATLAGKATDLDGIAVTYTKKSGPDWLSVSPAGVLSGTPGDEQLGENAFVVTARNDLLGADADIKITVLFNNHAPFWTQNPIVLPNGLGGSPYSQPVGAFAKDPDPSDALTITKVTGPAWASVSSNGVISGTPARKDFGLATLTVKVTDPDGLSATTTVQFMVDKPNEVPVWLQNPLALTDALQDTAYAFSLKNWATDADNEPLTFALVEGPSWMSVAPSGAITGTPVKEHIGTYTAKFSVTDGKDTVLVSANGRVLRKNYPPSFKDTLTFTIKERSHLEVNLNDPKYVTNPDEDPLTFRMISTSPFVTLSGPGILTADPLYANIGTHNLSVTVSDGELAATATLKIIVERDPRPPVWSENPIRFSTKARVAFAQKVSDKVKDLDGLPLTFAKLSGPAWLTVDAKGNISGTPADTDLGDNTFELQASNDKLSAPVTLIVTVLFNNHAPFWTQNPITGTDAFTDVNYAFLAKEFAKDPDVDDVLTCAKVSGPAWASVTSDCSITGKPVKADVGTASIQMKVSDPSGLSATTTVVIKVFKTNGPPVWTQNPVRLPDATQETPYAFSLATLVTDEDGDPLTFRKVAGPTWLSVAPSGALSGTPMRPDLGDFTARFAVSDGKAEVEVDATGRVLKKNHAPVVKQDLNLVMKERAVLSQTLNDVTIVEDEDGDAITFKWVTATSQQDFASLSAEGILTAKPVFKDIGKYALKYQVTDGTLSAIGTINLTVERDPRPPVWLENPMTFQAKARVPFTDTLVGKANDLDGLALTYELVSGPSWLKVSPAGLLSGTPLDENVGENRFFVRVKNDALGADATVIVNVLFNNHAPYWTQDPITLPTAFTGVQFEQVVANFATDPDMGSQNPAVYLRFTKVSGPAWVGISSDGRVIGTPGLSDVGTATVKVRVSDPEGLSAVATVNVPVEKTNHAPVWSALVLPNGLEDKAYSFNARPFVSDVDGDTLTIAKVSGPDWLSVSAQGLLTGTPREGDVGPFSVELSATDGKLSANASGSAEVKAKNHPPVVNAENLKFTVKERETLSVNLNDPKYVTDSDGNPLTFKLVGASDFVVVSPSGSFTASPVFKHIGVRNLTLEVSDGESTVPMAVELTVLRNPRPPVWLENPILYTAKTKKAFSADLSLKAKDLDGLPLTFSKVSGAAWVSVAANGKISGTPMEPEVGDNEVAVMVRNDVLGAEALVIITVDSTNQAPVWTKDPIALGDHQVSVPFTFDLSPFAMDPDNDPLVFSLVSGPAWLTLSAGGQLMGTPEDVGEFVAQFKVSDGKLSDVADGFGKITPLPEVLPPVWTEVPVRIKVVVGAGFSVDLKTKATDPQGLPLTFAKVTGPDWVNLLETGALSGTAPNVAGITLMDVVASNGKKQTPDQVEITVVDSGPSEEVVVVDSPVPGAKVENLWVIDSSWPYSGYNPILSTLYYKVATYFDALQAANIHHTGVYLSSDPRQKWKGVPVPDDAGELLLSYTQNNWVPGFQQRINRTFTRQPCSSPIWSMWSFYQKVPTSSIYQNGYFEKHVPMETLVVSKFTDKYRNYATGAQARWTASEFADSFKAFHLKEEKSYRIHAIAPECPRLDEFPKSGKDTYENSYKTLVAKTKGVYFPYECNFDMDKVMKEYAKQVITRAYIHAKERIALKKVPSNVASIKVSLAGLPLAATQWQYDEAKNEVVMLWHLIDLSKTKPGDVLRIEYQ